jgi:hypothetical protein
VSRQGGAAWIRDPTWHGWGVQTLKDGIEPRQAQQAPHTVADTRQDQAATLPPCRVGQFGEDASAMRINLRDPIEVQRHDRVAPQRTARGVAERGSTVPKDQPAATPEDGHVSGGDDIDIHSRLAVRTVSKQDECHGRSTSGTAKTVKNRG